MSKSICFIIALSYVLLTHPLLAQSPVPVTVASYNLRYNNSGDGVNAWPNRKENVKALIQFHEFDLFGTQEGLRGQLDDIAELPDYAFLGVGRDDGKSAGEHSAIFYRKSRFTVLQSGNFWLSETPGKPGKGWDATCCNRICSWAKFDDKTTGKSFFFFNVHFDHQGVVARRESGKLIVQEIKKIAGNVPVILTGDFNSTPDTEQIKTILTLLFDTYAVTKMPPHGPIGTFNSFKFGAPFKDRIDYMFVSKQFDVLKYGALTDAKEQRYPSDHLPVIAKVVLK